MKYPSLDRSCQYIFLGLKLDVLLLVSKEADLGKLLLIYCCPCNCCSSPAQLSNKLVALSSTNLSSTNITNNLVERIITSVCYLHSTEKLPFFCTCLPVRFSQLPTGEVRVCALNSAVFKGFIPCPDGLIMLKIY